MPPNYVSIDHTTSSSVNIRKHSQHEKISHNITKLSSKALSTSHLPVDGLANDLSQSDSYEEILLDSNVNRTDNAISSNNNNKNKHVPRERNHSFSASSDLRSTDLQHCLHHHKHNQVC